MPLSDMIGMFGSNNPPTAIQNRFAAPTQLAGRRLATNTLNAIRTDLPNAYNTYIADQGLQRGLADEQAGTLRTLLNRRMGYDPNQNLRDIFETAFSQIDPNIISRLSAGDVARGRLNDRVTGRTAGVDSTMQRLRDAATNSGRYYDLARNVYNVVPTLFNQSYSQGLGSDQAAAGYIPGISAAYEAVANRPMQGIMNRINAVRAGQGIETQGIANAMASTQGYQQDQNWADKFSKALKADEQTVMQIAQMALSAYTGGLGGGMGGGGGGGMGGLMSMFGGGGGGAGSGAPAGSGFQPNISSGGTGYIPEFYYRGPQ